MFVAVFILNSVDFVLLHHTILELFFVFGIQRVFKKCIPTL
jgi:hypothetical protein